MAQFFMDPSSVSKLDPITRQRMLTQLPEIQRRMRRSKKLRGDQATLKEMRDRDYELGGVSAPVTRGLTGSSRAAFDPIGSYIPNYSAMGKQLVGAFGEYLTGKAADKSEEELEAMRNPEILGAIGQMDRKDIPGGPTEKELRAYLGMLGQDTGDLGLGKGDKRVHSLKTDKQGRVWSISSDPGESPIDTGIDELTRYRIVTDPVTGESYQIPTSSAGAGESTQVLAPGEEPGFEPTEDTVIPGDPATGAPTMGIEGMDEANQQRIQTMVQTMQASGVPQPVIDQYVAQEASQAQVQPPAPPKPLTIGGAGDVEAAKIEAQNAAGAETAVREGQQRQSERQGEMIANAKEQYPKARDTALKIREHVQYIRDNSELLKKLTGGSIPGRVSSLGAAGDFLNNILVGGVQLEGQEGADLQATMNQLADESFLASYQEALKGTGQVATVEALKTAQANLRKAQFQSPERYMRAVEEFLKVFENSEQRLLQLINQPLTPSGGAPTNSGAPALPPGFSWEP